MIEVVYSFGVELDWTAAFAQQLGGTVGNGFMEIPKKVFEGMSRVLHVDQHVSVWYLEGTYHSAVYYHGRHKTHDFITVVYNMAEGEAIRVVDEEKQKTGRWNYNFAILDSTIDNDYIVEEGTKSFSVLIFVKKEFIKQYLITIPQYKDQLSVYYDPKKNTIIKVGRTSNQAWWLLQELRSKKLGNSAVFDIFVRGTVWLLLADCLDDAKSQEVIIGNVNQGDLARILASQELLVNHLEASFPGIDVLAKEACMSPTKYKTMFRKITGLSPNAFYQSNKLEHARKLLESGKFSVGEVAEKLKFANGSYLSEQFKNYFGIGPKDFVSKL